MKSSSEFVPLDLPGMGGEKTPPTAPAAPVNWFTQVAPALPEAVAAPKITPAQPVRNGSAAAAFGFRDVDVIKSEERERKRQREPEPPGIARLRQEAEQAAQKMIEQAQIDALAITEEAQQKGYQAGYQAGYTDGTRMAEQAVWQQAQIDRAAYRADIAAFIAHIEAERQRAWAEIEPQAIRLVFDLAKHVIKQEVEVSRDISLAVVQNALRRVADAGTLRIRVNPEDLQTVRGNREDLLTLVDNIRNVEIIEDRRVGVGGCIVETEGGNIDARLENQIAEVANILELER